MKVHKATQGRGKPIQKTVLRYMAQNAVAGKWTSFLIGAHNRKLAYDGLRASNCHALLELSREEAEGLSKWLAEVLAVKDIPATRIYILPE